MDESQIAPLRIAPRPVLKKYLPESIELLQGVQEGEFTKAFLNNTPSLATRSMFGVLTTSLMVGLPSIPL
jgi:hypothetical protein